MRKLIYHIATTLDNFIAHKDGTADGFLFEGVFMTDFLESIKTYDAVLMGRKTYEAGFQYGLQKGQPAYIQINPDLKNYIFSKTMDFEPKEKIEIIKHNEINFIEQLKLQKGKDIWLCGGGTLAATLLDNELIDEVIIKLNPIVFGEGIRLFGNSKKKINLMLNNCKTYENGLALLSYNVDYKKN